MEERNWLPILLGGILIVIAVLVLYQSPALPSQPGVTTVTTTTVTTTVATTTTVIGTSTVTTTTPITKTWTTTAVVTIPPTATTTQATQAQTTSAQTTPILPKHEFVGWYVAGSKVDGARATANVGDNVELRLKLTAGSTDMLGTVTVEIKKDISLWFDEVHCVDQKTVAVKAGQSTVLSTVFTADAATSEGGLRSYFYRISGLVSYDPTDPNTRECLFVTPAATTTTTTPTIIAGKVEYQQAAFKFGGLNGAWIRVVAGMEVAVDVKVKVIGTVQGPLKVEVKRDVVGWSDNVHQTLIKSISLKDAEQWISMGTFIASEPTSTKTFAVREYFIKVYFADQPIYDPQDPQTREWVKTYDFYCYTVDSTGATIATTTTDIIKRGQIAGSTGSVYGEKIWIQVFLTADGQPIANREVQFIAKYPDGSSRWFWTDGTNAQGFCHKDWTISREDLDKGSYIDFTVQLYDRYYSPTGLMVYGDSGGSGAYLGNFVYRVNISW